MTTRPLTRRQAAVLAYLRRYHAQHGWAPSLREICAACDVSSTSVARFTLDALGRTRLPGAR